MKTILLSMNTMNINVLDEIHRRMNSSNRFDFEFESNSFSMMYTSNIQTNRSNKTNCYLLIDYKIHTNVFQRHFRNNFFLNNDDDGFQSNQRFHKLDNNLYKENKRKEFNWEIRLAFITTPSWPWRPIVVFQII